MDFVRLFFFFSCMIIKKKKILFWYFERSEEGTEEYLTVWFAKIKTKLKQFFSYRFLHSFLFSEE